ncbi:hypothetical protein Q427_32980 [Halomonas sp. BC04]|nr:hypothetical protein [Halomonas sp. BC04]EWG98010.1 hypothetical protein Q427_32980 [Halomonas sp. BC04]
MVSCTHACQSRRPSHDFTPRPPVLLRLLKLLAPYRGRLAIAALALLVASASVLLLGQGLRLVIDQGFLARDSTQLNQTLAAMLAVVSVLAAASALRYYQVSWIGERLAGDLRRRSSIICSSFSRPTSRAPPTATAAPPRSPRG